MSAQFKHSCRFHAADTAADNMNGFGRSCFLYVMLVPLHRFRIDGTTRKVQTVRKVLIVRHALVMTHIEAAVMTEYAGTYIVLLVVHEFCYPALIRQELTCKARAVKFSICNGVSRRFGVKSARADNGDIYKFFDMFYVLQVAVFGHIYRRVRPIPCVVSAVVAIQAVITCVLQIFCRFFGFRHISADFGIFFSRQRALAESLCF